MLEDLLEAEVTAQEQFPLTYTFPKVVDSSMLSLRRLCPQRATYNYLYNLATPGLNAHLHAGGTLATAMHIVRSNYTNGMNARDAEELGYRSLFASWQGIDLQHETKNLGGIVDAYSKYISVYPVDTDILRVTASELNFAIPTSILHPETGEPILYAGRTDALGTVHSMPVIVDEKTMGKQDSLVVQKYRLRPQFLAYTYILREHFNLDIAGVVVRGVVVNKSACEPFEFFCTYSTEQLKEWWWQVQEELLAWVREYKYRRPAMRNGDACTEFNRVCIYQTLCSSPRASLKDQYKNYSLNTWDPLRREV